MVAHKAKPTTSKVAAAQPKATKARSTASATTKKTTAKATTASQATTKKTAKTATTAKTKAASTTTATTQKSTAAVTKKTPAAKKPAAATKKTPAKASARGNGSAAKPAMILTPEERYQMIETAAYFIAEHQGFQGRSDEHWAAAEQQIAAQLGQ